MGDTLNWIAQKAEQVVDVTATATVALVSKGKSKVDEYTLKKRLEKARIQLGKLAYAQQKTGEANAELVAMYVHEIDEILDDLEDLQPEKPVVNVHNCPGCGAGVKKDAMFCSGCGEKLP